MEKIKKNYKKLIALVVVSFVLVGCIKYDASGQPTGWVFEYIGRPTIQLLDWIAGLFTNASGEKNYGLAIIIVTILTRIFMLPSSIKMTKSSMMSAAKMELAQPEIKEIQAEMDATQDPSVKAQLQQELLAVHKKYDINMFGDTLGGCLPLLIQMPFITAVYAAIRSSQEIASSSFLGIHLGKRSILIVALVVLAYFLQGWLMQKQSTVSSSNPQAQQTTKMMMLMNPLMLGWISWASAAGLGLYFLTGGIFMIVQQLYINHQVRPRIEAMVEEKREYYESLPRTKRKRKVNVQQETSSRNQRLVPTKNTSTRRNEGKQRR